MITTKCPVQEELEERIEAHLVAERTGGDWVPYGSTQVRLPEGWAIEYCGPTTVEIVLDEGPIPTSVRGTAMFRDDSDEAEYPFSADLVRVDRVMSAIGVMMWQTHYEIHKERC